MLLGLDAVKTTIQLDDHLHKLAHRHAATRGITFTALVEEALREKLLSEKKTMSADTEKRIVLKTVGGEGMFADPELE